MTGHTITLTDDDAALTGGRAPRPRHGPAAGRPPARLATLRLG